VGPPFEAFLSSVEGVPEHQVSLWTQYTFHGRAKGFSVGGGYIYMGKRRGGRRWTTISFWMLFTAWTRFFSTRSGRGDRVAPA
jgi:outer membrane receptor protein involved in Fe transport